MNNMTLGWEYIYVSPDFEIQREAEFVVCPSMLFVFAAEKDVSSHIVEAIIIELIQFQQSWISFSFLVRGA